MPNCLIQRKKGVKRNKQLLTIGEKRMAFFIKSRKNKSEVQKSKF